mgnify:CR=1 FL=1
MKRSALLFGALVLGAAAGVNAQGLTMQMSNGWMFSFAGNVNIFAMYQSVSESGLTAAPAGIVGVGGKGLYYGTGLLPSVASFDAKGKEGATDLSVHFGFFPQVQCGGNAHDCFGSQFSGASIDMRQVFLTAGGSWGTITAGREIGVYQRQNILNDQTLFGVGGGGVAPRGTTLGRIGFGYVYPNFVPQFTYSSPGGKSTSFNIGLMEPSTFGNYAELSVPRLEADMTYKANKLTFNVSGTAQNGKDPTPGGFGSKTAVGGAAVVGYKGGNASLTGSGYYGKGIGTTLMFTVLPHDANGDLTTSYGYIGQATYTSGKATLAGSYGASTLKDKGDTFKTENGMISGGVYYQATKSLKVVGEGDYQWTKEKVANNKKNSSFTGSFGLMLFY